MIEQKDVDSARAFVENRILTRKEIKLVRRMMKLSGFIPGLPKLSKDAKKEVLRILDEKELERQKTRKDFGME